ncbi:MAG: hypothetical protein R3B91_11515 [Planctomycetaceae bacterium]
MLIFRFTAGLILILLVSMIGIKLEKDELALKRTISLQHYRMDQLLEEPLSLTDSNSRTDRSVCEDGRSNLR